MYEEIKEMQEILETFTITKTDTTNQKSKLQEHIDAIKNKTQSEIMFEKILQQSQQRR